ncbi:MAG: hypothetical protein HY080_14740 [Gammaproteobacteria bacterium]|nr:hypothetical protein [Gammaproteobacteria bacterium]
MSQRTSRPDPIRIFPKSITADCYNRIRTLTRHLTLPLRVDLPGHRGLQAVLDSTEWLVVNSLDQDELIMAWMDFAVAQRQGLQEPVQCQLYLYHMHAGLIMGSVLDDLLQAVERTFAAP